jgi:histidine triad (HIT) family protein
MVVEISDGQGHSQECIFCDIVRGKVDAQKVFGDDLSLAILDINPFSKGHCLVVPKRHVPWWHDLSEEEVESIFRVARTVAGKIARTFEPDFVCMYARGRRIPHTHIFLVPTYKDDPLDRFFNALEGFQEAPVILSGLRDKNSMEETAEILRSI